jgi:S1-C subfamily serine protease
MYQCTPRIGELKAENEKIMIAQFQRFCVRSPAMPEVCLFSEFIIFDTGGGNMNSLRVSFVFAAVLLSLSGVCAADSTATDSQISEKALQSTVRLERRCDEGNYIRTGHGSAFGIDLSRYGIESHRYMLSAAHLVLDKDTGQITRGDLCAEVGKAHSWAKCRVVALDKTHDLCLLECDRDLETLSKLGGDDQKLGARLLFAGSPLGVPICLSSGRLVSKEPKVEREVWEAEAKFDHGNSGGPVFDADTGKLVGVAVAGLRTQSGDMKENIAFFTPLKLVKSFLSDSVAEILLKSNKILSGISIR